MAYPKEPSPSASISSPPRRSRFRRALIKISGELLGSPSDSSVRQENLAQFAKVIGNCREIGLEVALVVGGGNFWRGSSNASSRLDRGVADRVGMLATVMNGILLADALTQAGLRNKLYCAFEVSGFAPVLDTRHARSALEDGEIILLSGGVGIPMFTTDTGAVLRAAELNCDVVLKGTQVDGVYDSDPKSEAGAKRFDTISCSEILDRKLKVLDSTAATLACEASMPIEVFCIHPPDQLYDVVCGTGKSTRITPD